MRKPFKGQAALAAGGKSYRLYLDVNLIIDAEKVIGKPLPQVMTMISQGYLHVIRSLLHLAAITHHPEVTEAEIGEAVFSADEAELTRALSELFRDVMPAAKEGEQGEDPPEPGATPAGTGTGSTAGGVRRGSSRPRSGSRPRG